jgi:hypothetical protein
MPRACPYKMPGYSFEIGINSTPDLNKKAFVVFTAKAFQL